MGGVTGPGSTGATGVFGGSFDPVHLGHLLVAELAREQMGLAQVLFLPAARSPLKDQGARAGDQDRLAMLRLAIADQPAFGLSTVDLDRPPPSYTVDSLERLRAAHPQVTDWVLILGADSLASFAAWRRPERICDLARLAVYPRPGSLLDLAALTAQMPYLRGRVTALEGPRLELSATEIRRRLGLGRSVRYQLPEAVRAHVRAAGLYRAAASARPAD